MKTTRFFTRIHSTLGATRSTAALLLCFIAHGASGLEWQATTAPVGSWTGIPSSADASKFVAVSYYLPI